MTWWNPRVLPAAGRRRDSTWSATTTATPAAPSRGDSGRVTRRTWSRASSGAGSARAVHARRHGRRRLRAARPPRHRRRARGRGLDGRHDRADPGDGAPRPGAVADLDHVHHRPPHASAGRTRGCCRACWTSGARTREEYVEGSARFWRSSAHRPSRDDRTRPCARGPARPGTAGVSASGTMRQMVAIVTQPDRTRRLAARRPHRGHPRPATGWCTSPAAVPPPAPIPGAELVLVPGMGHDLPTALARHFVDAIRRTADRAVTAAQPVDGACRPGRGPRARLARRQGDHLGHRVLEVADQVPHVRNHLAAGDQPEVQRAVVGEQRDVQATGHVGHRRDRVDPLDARAGDVERQLRTRARC